MYLPALAAELAEGNGFLRGQVNKNEAIDARGLAVGQEALFAIAEEGVVVAHDEDGGFEASVAGGLDHGEGGGDGYAIVEGDLNN